MCAATRDELASWLRADESAAALLQRVLRDEIATSVPFLDEFGFYHGDLLEISGPPGSGKTELLVQIAATALLEGLPGGSPPRGPGASVLFLDVGGRFDVLRLAQVLSARILDAVLEQPDAERLTDRGVRDALSRLSVITCRGTSQYVEALERHAEGLVHGGGPPGWGGPGAEAGPSQRPRPLPPLARLVLIDDPFSYEAQDVAVRGTLDPNDPHAPPSLHSLHRRAADALRGALAERRVAVVATRRTREAPAWRERSEARAGPAGDGPPAGGDGDVLSARSGGDAVGGEGDARDQRRSDARPPCASPPSRGGPPSLLRPSSPPSPPAAETPTLPLDPALAGPDRHPWAPPPPAPPAAWKEIVTKSVDLHVTWAFSPSRTLIPLRAALFTTPKGLVPAPFLVREDAVAPRAAA